jgi:hypothetical protein
MSPRQSGPGRRPFPRTPPARATASPAQEAAFRRQLRRLADLEETTVYQECLAARTARVTGKPPPTAKTEEPPLD